MMTQEQQKALFSAPIPGSSLTSDPDSPAPYETPPEYTDLKTFIDDMFMNITNEDNIDGILDPLRKGVSVEDVAEMLLFSAFSSGKITPDLQLLAAEPTIYLIVGIGQMFGVEDMVLYDEEDFEMDEDEQANLLDQDGNRIGDGESAPDIRQIKAPTGISKSLMGKLLEQGKEE